MRFSEEFDIDRGRRDDWFDPLLREDTRLYVDPFLLFQDPDPSWAQAHRHIISFFNLVLRLIAQSGFDRRSAHWAAASRLLRFPEPAEFCLGHSRESIEGSGSGWGLGQLMLGGCVEAIRAGITQVRHFEELIIFGPGIGVDRISDITCNVIKSRFIEYTQRIANRHNIPVEQLPIVHASWSAASQYGYVPPKIEEFGFGPEDVET